MKNNTNIERKGENRHVAEKKQQQNQVEFSTKKFGASPQQEHCGALDALSSVLFLHWCWVTLFFLFWFCYVCSLLLFLIVA